MNEEFNNSVDSQAEVTDTPKATLNGVELGAPEATAKNKKLAVGIIAATVFIIAAAVLVFVFLIKKPHDADDKTVESVSSVEETSASESTSSETSETETEPEEQYGTTVASSDFSAGLTDEGFVKGADLTKVTELDVLGMEIPYASVDYIDDKVNADILSVAEQYASYSDDSSLTVQNGNTINLNYAGYMDGVQFDGGTADYQTLTIGSGTFIDNFEEQLIGYHPGDDVTVNVTFPEAYGNADLAGKPAVFECHINSIYRTPEVNDDFVKSYLSDYAEDLESLKAYVKEQGYQSNIDTFIATYISENASVSEYPEEYISYLKSLLRYSDEQNFAQYQTYMMYYGYSDAAGMTFADYIGVDAGEYEAYLDTSARQQTTLDMTYESIFKNAGLTIDEDVYDQILDYYGGESALETYGEPFIKQTSIKYTVINYLKANATVTGAPTE